MTFIATSIRDSKLSITSVKITSFPAVLNSTLRGSQKPPWTISVPKVDTRLHELIARRDFPQLVRIVCLDYIADKYEENNFISVYTDGSKLSTGAAYSMYVPALSLSIAEKCDVVHSPYAIELLAVKRALLWISSRNHPSNNIYVILCDCLSAIQAIGSPFYQFDHPTINQILEIFQKIEKNSMLIRLVWVPGHACLPGNEKADRLARETAASSAPVQNSGPVSKPESKSLIHQYISIKWNNEYQILEKGSDYKKLYPTISPIPSHTVSRKIDTILFRLRSGHCRLNSHLYKIGCLDSPSCEFCDSSETVEHFLLACPEFESQRTPLRNATLRLNLPFSLQSLLLDPRLLDLTVEFVLSSNKLV